MGRFHGSAQNSVFRGKLVLSHKNLKLGELLRDYNFSVHHGILLVVS